MSFVFTLRILEACPYKLEEFLWFFNNVYDSRGQLNNISDKLKHVFLKIDIRHLNLYAIHINLPWVDVEILCLLFYMIINEILQIHRNIDLDFTIYFLDIIK